MCGIVAYTGFREAYPILLKGLHRLEYRGYDSAGIALLPDGGEIAIHKKKGRVEVLEAELAGMKLPAQSGIGHTRWATHGEPNDRNAHPHLSPSGRLAVVHNGIIENYVALKKSLLAKGYRFQSDTDTEVLLTFIESFMDRERCVPEEAVRMALRSVTGTYVIVLLDRKNPGKLVAARKGGPLVIGIGKREHFLASDPTAMVGMVGHSKRIVYVRDQELVVVTPEQFILKNADNQTINPFVETLDVELAAIEKGGFANFMLKEICEQADTLENCLRGRLDLLAGAIKLPGFQQHQYKLSQARAMVLIGCGTSWHAALVAEYIFEELCQLPVEVEYASEFRYRSAPVRPGDLVIGLSQSGETADTIVALEKAKEKKALVLGIVNTVGSSIARLTDGGAYLHIGPEIGVASTKAFTAQLMVLTLVALSMAEIRGTLERERFLHLLHELSDLPSKIRKVLAQDGHIRAVAQVYKNCTHALYLGRGSLFPIALEGALKLKEISYIHAEGYPAAEMKHGPIALVDETLPVVCLALQDALYEKMVSAIQEVKARKGRVIAVITEGDEFLRGLVDDCIEIPPADSLVAPILSVVPLQLLAYHIGVARGCDIDKPRNLAKSVTVE